MLKELRWTMKRALCRALKMFDKMPGREQYNIRNECGYTEVLVVCKKWIVERAAFVDAVRIEPLKSSLKDGEKSA